MKCPDKAKRLLKHYLTLCPDNARINRKLGNSYRDEAHKLPFGQRRDDYLEAETFYQKCLSLKSETIDLTRKLAKLYGDRLGQYTKAETYYVEYLKHRPNHSTIQCKLGDLYFRQLGNHEKALDCFNRAALSLTPNEYRKIKYLKNQIMKTIRV
eukprot:UN26409